MCAWLEGMPSSGVWCVSLSVVSRGVVSGGRLEGVCGHDFG
jgi:hypothetical protein